MQNIGYIRDKLLRNHTYKIIVIHWMSYQPFEQPGPELLDMSEIGAKCTIRLLPEIIISIWTILLPHYQRAKSYGLRSG